MKFAFPEETTGPVGLGAVEEEEVEVDFVVEEESWVDEVDELEDELEIFIVLEATELLDDEGAFVESGTVVLLAEDETLVELVALEILEVGVIDCPLEPSPVVLEAVSSFP